MATYALLSVVMHEHAQAQQAPLELGAELAAAGHDVTVIYTLDAFRRAVLPVRGTPDAPGVTRLLLRPRAWDTAKPKHVEKDQKMAADAGFTVVDIDRFHTVVSTAETVLSL